MLIGESRSSNLVVGRQTRSAVRQLAVVVVLLGIAACNPVETWRDLTGASQNDPDPETTPNTGNLAAGEAADYPNLATVPAPPVRAMTAAERDKLTQSLIADQANARHTNEQLRAGFAPAAPPPPAPAAGSGGTEPEPTAAPSPSSPGPVASSVASTARSVALPSENAGGGKPVLLGPASSPAAAASLAPTGEGAAGGKPAAVAGARSARAAGKTPGESPGQGLRKQGEPPEPAPMESSLEVPQARATPQPEQIQPAPPPPQLPPTPKVASTATHLPGGLAAGGALASTPLPDAKGSAGFEPAPATPELAPVPPARSADAGAGKGGPKPPASVDKPIAEIKFGANSTSLTDSGRQTLESVVPIYRQNPGKLRVVGYAGEGSGAVEQLNSYRTALDRAQAVAAALSKAGIPSDKIQVEAAPTGTNSGDSRAEVLLEH